MKRIFRQWFAGLLAVVLVFALLPATALAEGFSDSLNGEGNENSPYQISTAEQLRQLSEYVNGGKDCAGLFFKLMGDIDLGGAEWTPVGTQGEDSHAFRGTFDGSDHTISGLYINQPDKDNLGLFGYIGLGGTVKNLTVEGKVTGRGDVAGIVGDNSGTVENCHNNCEVHATGTDSGGIVGSNSRTVTNCYNSGKISGFSMVGGITGVNDGGTVTNCYNVGEITGTENLFGGIVGTFVGGTAKDCYNAGTVTGTSDNTFGAIAGWISSGTVTNCYYLEDTADKGVGSGETGTTKKTAAEFGNLASLLNSGGDAWEDDPFLGRPVLTANREPSPISGKGTAEEPYLIPDKAALEIFRDYLKSDSSRGENMFFKLTADIDLEGSEGNQWTPIQNLKGTFDGAGHTISGLLVDETNQLVGLFRQLDGTVKNLGVSGSVTGSQNVGGIVGQSYSSGTIENCYFTGTVKSSGSSSGQTTGGITGLNNGTIRNCYNSGTVESSNGGIGGIAGQSTGGTIENCYNTGDVTGGRAGGILGLGSNCTVKNSYNTGIVSGTREVGGIAGYNDSTIQSCYYLDGTAMTGVGAGDGDSSGATAKSAAQFRFLASTLGDGWADSVEGRPVLLSNQEADIISGDVPYEIPDKETMEAFRDYINKSTDGGAGKTFKLTKDIDLGGAGNPWTPIGTDRLRFQGTFDGDDRTISGLNITSGVDNQGLFGVIGNSGTVKNLTVKGSVTGGQYVGGIAGHSFGNIENCHNAASIRGSYWTGGVVGYMEGTASVQKCSNTGAVNGGSSSKGGIAGYVTGTIRNCYNAGEVTGTGGNGGGIAGYLASTHNSTVENCYNVGVITGSGITGGIVGNSNGTVQSCYNYGIVNGSGGPVRGNERGVCSNCYYLDTWVKDGRGAEPKSAEQFASGEVAYLLQKEQGAQVWGQTVGSSYPELTDSPDKKVYQITGKVEEQDDIIWYSNSEATLPAAPSKEGYTFVGWSKEEEGTEADFGQGATVDKDMTVYAVFKEITSGGGSGSYPSYFSVTVPSDLEGGSVTADSASTIQGSRVTLTVKPDEGHHLGSLTVTDRNGKPVEITDNGDGTYTFTMPYGQATVKAEFTKCGSLSFTDLDIKAWYHDYTDYVINHGLMRGSGGLFDPDGMVTRAQMVTVLWNMRGKPVVNYYMTYSDVTEDAWYAEAVRWAASEGIAKGYGNGKFGPGDPISREQMAVMIYRYEQKYGDGGFTGDWMYRLPFTDLDQISDWAFEAVAWCNMKGVMSGKADNIFDPKGLAKRSEMAAILTRYCELGTAVEAIEDIKE